MAELGERYPRLTLLTRAAPPVAVHDGVVIKAVLFDFAGTLFGRPSSPWLDPPLAALLRSPAPFVARMTPAERAGWEVRDLSVEANHAAYSCLFRLAGLPLSDEVFARLHDPACWLPYPDTSAALERVRPLRVGVLSNITWDIRAVFARESFVVDAFALSFELGACKPSAEVFLAACVELGIAPQECLMVGDDPVADGGAAEAGLRFASVATGPVGVRPPVLLAALARHGIR